MPFIHPHQDKVVAVADDLIVRFGLRAHDEALRLADVVAQMRANRNRRLHRLAAREIEKSLADARTRPSGFRADKTSGDSQVGGILIQHSGWRWRPAGTAEPPSIDLRKRVVAAIKGGMSRRGAAAHFQVGVSSAIRWGAQVEKSGDLSPKPQGGDRRSAAIEAQADTILSLLAAAPGVTLMELQAGLAERGHRFNVSTIWRFFSRRKITLKKGPRARPNRKAGYPEAARGVVCGPARPRSRQAGVRRRDLGLNQQRRYGRAPRGERLRAAVPHGH